MQMIIHSPKFRLDLAGILLLSFAFTFIVPRVASAELSEQSLVGPGMRLRPAYDGSASQHAEFVPVVRYLGSPWFVRSTQGILEGGLRMEIAPGLHAGAQVAYEPGREKSQSDFLRNHNVSNIDSGASVGLQVEWDHKFGPVPVTLLARARQHTDSDRGAQADLRLSVGAFHSARVSAGVFTQATWANAKSTASFYDVAPQQVVTTGLPAFRAGGGLMFASAGVLWSVDLNQDWIVVGSMEARHLYGDAERSPLAERNSNYYGSVGLAYRF